MKSIDVSLSLVAAFATSPKLLSGLLLSWRSCLVGCFDLDMLTFPFDFVFDFNNSSSTDRYSHNTQRTLELKYED